MQCFDVIIIGGGIIGTAVARELSKYKIDIALLESKLDIAAGSTKGNGGIIHAGYDPKSTTLKAKLNSKGALMYPKLSKELGFKFNNNGSMVVGFNEKDLAYIKELYENGQKNGVPDLRIIEHDEIVHLEPHINPDAKFALLAPSAGLVEPYEVAIAFAENACTNGAKIYRGSKVIKIERENSLFKVITEDSIYLSRYLVNSAGIHADEIAKMVGIYDYTINPRLGEILMIDRAIGFELNKTLFPTPGPNSKGVAMITTLSGNMIVGSTARMVEDKEETSAASEGISELIEGAKKLVTNVDERSIIRQFTGLRPVVLETENDFVIEASRKVKGFINAIGIQSPGIASAPAIAEMIRDILQDEGLELAEKDNFIATGEPTISFYEASYELKDELISKNSMYGNIICRCECVTEAEIVDAIRRPVGATTLDGIKRRTRAGMGRCQGGFCQHKVLSILSRELGIPKEKILLEDETSNIVMEELR